MCSKRTAMYYHKLDNKSLRCEICPHHCILNHGDEGFCRGRKNIDGEMVLLYHGKITSAQLDPIEKKPIHYFMPGSKVFSIGGFGCNLSCLWCQNWLLLTESERAFSVPFSKLIDYASKDGSIGFAFTYNEPTVWYEYMLDLAKTAKQKGLVNILVTNGFINESPFLALLNYIDAVNIDLKLATEHDYLTYTKGNYHHVLRNIELAASRVHVEVSTLLIDGINTADWQIEKIASDISAISADIPLHLSRYYPAYLMDQPATKLESMKRAKRIALKYLNRVNLGNMPFDE